MNLVSKKGDKNDYSSALISCLLNSILVSIVDTPENDLFHSEGKSVTSKVFTSSLQ